MSENNFSANSPDESDSKNLVTNVRKSNTGINPEISFIHRRYIPKEKITKEHAAKCIGPDEDITIHEKLAHLNKIKKDAKEWFRHEISKIFTTQLQKYDLFYEKILNHKIIHIPVKSLDDFYKKIEQDETDEFLKIIFEITYQYFDINQDWNQNLEQRYMSTHGFKYTESNRTQHRARDKGCFEVLACGEKTELVKKIQRIGKRNHGTYLTINLGKRDNGKHMKQRPGIFYKAFVKRSKATQQKFYQVQPVSFFLLNKQHYFLLYLTHQFYHPFSMQETYKR